MTPLYIPLRVVWHMDAGETNEVIRSAWLTAVLILLGVGGVLYTVFLFAGLFSTDPVTIRWWIGIASASFVVIIVLLIRGTWI